jgi:pantoate--beta-alanine ligase
MGYLHDGHLSLLRRAKKENDIVALSIYVNPAQFGPNEDFEKYPRDIKRDLALAKKEGVDLVFNPDDKVIYQENHQTYVIPADLENKLCGKKRPGHFKGVLTIVAKLLNIVSPDKIYLGQKDYQQALIIKQMISDLNFFCKARILPIVREPDGLAMSSRNKYLSTANRKKALVLYKALKAAEQDYKNGTVSVSRLKKKIRKIITVEKGIKLDYAEILDADTLKDVKYTKGRTLIALAAKVGGVRLIDNIIIKPR